jgi:hypothetical protein
LIKEDRVRLISNVIQLQNTTTRSSSAFELGSTLCHLYGVNPSIVAENWAVRMLKVHSTAAVDGVLRKIKTYDSVDYVRLAVAAKKYAIEISEVSKIVKCARDPKVRMIYILTELGNDEDAMKDVLQSLDGNAIVSYLFICRYKLAGDIFGQKLARSPPLADQYVAYRQYGDQNQYRSIMQIEGYPVLRIAMLEMLHDSERAFGKDSPKLNRVYELISGADKKSPFGAAIQNQLQVIGWMSGIAQRETPGVGFSPTPTKSPRFLLSQALSDVRSDLGKKFRKQYDISDKTFAWVQVHTFAAKKDWRKFAELALERSQPLPWEAYAEVCHTNNRREEAVAFVRKISSAEQRLGLFEKYEYWSEAAGAASELKSPRWAELNAKAKAAGDE